MSTYYTEITEGDFPVGAGQTVLVFPENEDRQYLVVQVHTGILYVNFGGVTDNGAKLEDANWGWEPLNPPKGPVYLYSPAGATYYAAEGPVRP